MQGSETKEYISLVGNPSLKYSGYYLNVTDKIFCKMVKVVEERARVDH